jgi:hypothetical protein
MVKTGPSAGEEPVQPRKTYRPIKKDKNILAILPLAKAGFPAASLLNLKENFGQTYRKKEFL